ncbi:hypothetical protein [Clostridium botulinum]|uniref:hypothetical protein n=1 Tax=Clostridium botulinum TaxID=1491 RepID=UPI001C9A62EF|nr:hypothetical protein [Clostridium botulinum]MBY6842621.1 hypothetical protein [Clostridium botulinum]
MNKYRVEFRTNSNDYQLKETKQPIKEIKNEEETGKCYYRRFPLGKSKKIYF